MGKYQSRRMCLTELVAGMGEMRIVHKISVVNLHGINQMGHIGVDNIKLDIRE